MKTLYTNTNEYEPTIMYLSFNEVNSTPYVAAFEFSYGEYFELREDADYDNYREFSTLDEALAALDEIT